MLVMTRKPGQQIQVGSNIVVTLVRLQMGSARIGIDAPKDMYIVRKELLEDGKPVSQLSETSDDE